MVGLALPIQYNPESDSSESDAPAAEQQSSTTSI